MATARRRRFACRSSDSFALLVSTLAGIRIRLLCLPRTFGYCFNPLSIYYCHRADGALAALIYQVHNTFGERHSYVLPVSPQPGAVQQRCRKQFHVSPFMDMALTYDFLVTEPGERIAVSIRVSADDGPLFNAALVGKRRTLTNRALIGLCLKMPAITLKVIGAIHWEALRLWLKGLRARPKPAAPENIDVRRPGDVQEFGLNRHVPAAATSNRFRNG